MKKEAKFCLLANGEKISIDYEGQAATISALFACAIDRDPKIREIIATALIAVISHDVIQDLEKDQNEESFKEMLSKMNIGLA